MLHYPCADQSQAVLETRTWPSAELSEEYLHPPHRAEWESSKNHPKCTKLQLAELKSLTADIATRLVIQNNGTDNLC